MVDIFDIKTRKWFRVERGWRNKLKFYPIIYTKVIRYPTSGDLVFEEGNLKLFKNLDKTSSLKF